MISLDWSSWSSWGQCSDPCNGGIRERTRTCFGDLGCIGNSKDVEICNTQSCMGMIFITFLSLIE